MSPPPPPHANEWTVRWTSGPSRPGAPLPRSWGVPAPRSQIAAESGRLAFLLAIVVFCNLTQAQDRSWRAVTHTGLHYSVSLELTSRDQLLVQQIGGKNSGQSIPPQLIERLEHPTRISSMAAVANRQVWLANGDVLHACLQSHQEPVSRVPPKELRLRGPGGALLTVPWSGIQAICQTPGTRCLVEQDFEIDALGWSCGSPDETPVRDQTRAQSGKNSLVCSTTHPSLKFFPPRPLATGWIQFRFFSEFDLNSSGETLLNFQFAPNDVHATRSGTDRTTAHLSNNEHHKSEQKCIVQVNLSGPDRRFEGRMMPYVSFDRQLLPHRAGWHTLTFEFSPQRQILTIDGDLLASHEFSNRDATNRDASVLDSVELVAQSNSSAVWIDDFIVLEAAPVMPVRQFQNETDEILFQSGDSLFGTLCDVNAKGCQIKLASNKTFVEWHEASQVVWKFATVPTQPVSGWNCRVELQPLWTMSDWRQADFLHGVLRSCDVTQVRIAHPILGEVSIPAEQVRQIKPLFRGFSWTMAGRPIHFGDEIESRFQSPSPIGTRWGHKFQLNSIPAGQTRIRLIAFDLEPAHPKTKHSALLDRLRTGEYITELRVNDAKPFLLNESVTGHGTPALPQTIELNLPQGHLRRGDNRLEINLKPSRDNIPEYDDWELIRLSLEIES